MRLRPVAPVLYVQANHATTLGQGGTALALLTRLPAIDGRHFDRPREFRPERWMTPSSAPDPSAPIPFGSGLRLCPGPSLALLEMKVVVAALFRNFVVEREGSVSAVREVFSFTRSPVGLQVRLRPRRPSGTTTGHGQRVTGAS